MELQSEIINSLDADLFEKQIVTASTDKKVRVYNLDNTTLNLTSILEGHISSVSKALFLNQGELIASACLSGTLIIWKLEAGKYNKKFETKIFDGSISTIAQKYTNKQITIWCGCSDGKIRECVFDNNFGMQMKEYDAHKYGVNALSCNNEYVLSCGEDQNVILWEIGENGLVVEETYGNQSVVVKDVAIAPATAFSILCFASCNENGNVYVYYLRDGGKNVEKQEIKVGEPCYSVAWSRAGFSLVVGFANNGFKSYAPDGEGKFVEVELEKIE